MLTVEQTNHDRPQGRKGKSKMNGYTITFKDFPKTYRFYVAANDEFQAVAKASARADKEIGKDFSRLCIMAGKMRIEKE